MLDHPNRHTSWGLCPTYSEELEAEGGDDAGQHANDHGTKWADGHVGAGSHGDTSGKGGILNVHLDKR